MQNENNFWTDELVKEMVYRKCGIQEAYWGNVQKMLDEFKQSKTQNPSTGEWNPETKKDMIVECPPQIGKTNSPYFPQSEKVVTIKLTKEQSDKFFDDWNKSNMNFQFKQELPNEIKVDYTTSEQSKEWEVVTVAGGEVGVVLLSGFYKNTLEEILKSGWHIHSVKRLSDGEVFTIGDEVGHTEASSHLNGKIKEFQVSENKEWIEIGIDKGSWMLLKYVKKIQPPSSTTAQQPQDRKALFTTEDGVAITADDDYILVSEHFNMAGCSGKDFKHPVSNGKRFADREKAKEYILMNKPALSVKEVCEKLHEFLSTSRAFDKLKQLAQSKIN